MERARKAEPTRGEVRGEARDGMLGQGRDVTGPDQHGELTKGRGHRRGCAKIRQAKACWLSTLTVYLTFCQSRLARSFCDCAALSFRYRAALGPHANLQLGMGGLTGHGNEAVSEEPSL